jgi:hypothetical protein
VGTVYNIPTAVAADCSVDVTSAINNWIASVPNGNSTNPSILNFATNKCYRIADSLGSADNQNPAGWERSYLVFEGNGSTLDGSLDLPPTHTNRDGIGLSESSNIIIQDFTIKGEDNGAWKQSNGQPYDNPCNIPFGDTTTNCHAGADGTSGYYGDREWHHGVGLFGCDHIIITNNHILDEFGDGVTLAAGPQWTGFGHGTSSYVTITNNVFDGNGRHGIGFSTADNIQMLNNSFDRGSYQVVDLENEAVQITNVTFSGNTIKRHWLGVVVATSGACLPRYNYTISNNTMLNTAGASYPPLNFNQDPNCTQVVTGLNIKHNTLLNYFGTTSVQIAGWTNVAVDSNRIAQVDSTDGPVQLNRMTGTIEVDNNDMRENAHVYSLDGVNDAPGVPACGDTTRLGSNQLTAC